MRREDIEKAAREKVNRQYLGRFQRKFYSDLLTEFAIQQVNAALESVLEAAHKHSCDRCLAPVDEAIRALKIEG